MKKERWQKRFKSLGFRMAAFYLIAGLLILSLFGGVVYIVVSDIFVRESVAKTEMAIEKTAADIGAEIHQAKSLLRLVSATSAFTDYAAFGSDEQKQGVMRLMEAIKENDSYVFEVFAAFADGRVISGNNGATLLDDAEYETLLKNNMPFLSVARSGSYAHDDGCVVTMGIPVQAETGESLGVLALDMDYCMFRDTIARIDFAGTIYITDEAGGVIFQTGDEAGLGGDFELGYDARENVLVQRYPIPETNWFVLGRAYLSGLDVLRRQLLEMVALTGALLFAALLMITVSHSRKLTTPIARLAGSMEDIESLSELTLLTDEISETKVLTESYNRMIAKIKLLMAELEQKQRELRQTEITALTNQINPHFLYNTLDTIVWLAEFKDNAKIIALTKSLAAFFRLSLNNGKELVSLRDEIEHVRQYLYIQKERYGDKLTYAFEVDETLLGCMVPKIILQPIVENSIYHGIKPMDGIGNIVISASQSAGHLLLTVNDNGVGFDVKKAGGVGLRNVEKRIKLYYGEGSGVDIASHPGTGTTVYLKLKMDLENFYLE